MIRLHCFISSRSSLLPDNQHKRVKKRKLQHNRAVSLCGLLSALIRRALPDQVRTAEAEFADARGTVPRPSEGG